MLGMHGQKERDSRVGAKAMVSGVFTTEMRDQGALLTRHLLDAGLRVSASLWLFESELDSWRLVLGVPEVDRRGPIEIYKTIRSVISQNRAQLDDLDIKNISVLSPKDSLLRILSSAVRVPTGGIRFSRNAIRGRFIEDAYIYRLTQAAA